MIRNRMRIGVMVVLVLASAGARSDQTTSGGCSPSIESMKANATVNVQCNFASSAQDAYLIATHPTTLQVQGATFTRWQEDNFAPFYSLQFKNASELPAINVVVDVLQPGSAFRSDQKKPFSVRRSNVILKVGSPGITITAGTTITLPVVSLKDLVGRINPDVPAGFCAYDGDLELDATPDESNATGPQMMAKAFAHTKSTGADEEPSIRTVGLKQSLIVRIRYSTVFQEKNTIYRYVYVRYAPRDLSDEVWYPSRKKFAPLECADGTPLMIHVGNLDPSTPQTSLSSL